MRVGLWVALCAALASPVRAEDRATARTHYEQGTTLYDLGKYREAAQEYEHAFRLRPDPALLFNIAQAYRLGGAYADALRAYKSYLRRQPQADNRAEVTAHIAKLEKLVEEQKQASASPPTGTIPPAGEPAASPKPVEPVRAAPAEVVRPPEPGPARETPKPVYRRWWLWTTVGLVAAAGVAVGLGVGLTQRSDITIPPGARTVEFP
jgi:tetratricopeptide (TPR) repeat protein